MKPRRIPLIVAALLSLLVPVSRGAMTDGAAFVPGEVLTGIRADRDDAPLKLDEGEDVQHFAAIHVHRVRLRPGLSIQEAIVRLQRQPRASRSIPRCPPTR
jgi:hypothetical protein